MNARKRSLCMMLALAALPAACDEGKGDPNGLLAVGGVDAGAVAMPAVPGSTATPVPGATTTPVTPVPVVPATISVGDCATLLTTATVAGTISTDQTWSGAVAVSGHVIVGSGSKITIAPGTTFVMGPDAFLDFGWNYGAVSVFARGTAAAPIRFCGKQATPGYYGGVSLGVNTTSDSVLENVLVSDAAKSDGTALAIGAAVLVKDVRVQNSAGDGVVASNFQQGSERLSVSGVAKLPVALLAPGAVSNFPLGGSFTGNGRDAIALRFGNIDRDTTFKSAGAPYLQEMDLIVSGKAKLTIEAGVSYLFAVDRGLDIGWNYSDATVYMNGTAAAPISFGPAGAPGSWKGIAIEVNVHSDSVLKYVNVTGGGSAQSPALALRASVLADHLVLDGNQTTGLQVEGKGGFVAGSTSLTITNTTGPAAKVVPEAMLTLPKGGGFVGNSSNWIEVTRGSIELPGTVPDLGIPFRVEGAFDTRGSSKLVIEPGVTFLMGPDSYVEFGWNYGNVELIAVGTAEKPIVFKGASPTPGSWLGVAINVNVLSSSKLDHVQIAQGGHADGAGLILRRAAVALSNSQVTDSAGFGIIKPTTDPTDYAAKGNALVGNALGAVGGI